MYGDAQYTSVIIHLLLLLTKQLILIRWKAAWGAHVK